MNYKTDDNWFWANLRSGPEALNRTAEMIAAEARDLAQKVDTEGGWANAEELGYDHDTIAWRIFLAEYLAELKKIENG